MPRDGSGIYTQPFPNVVEGTEIESSVYNGFTSDVALDLNSARPIVAGGTGGTNAPQALGALGAERSGDVVTNYDSHIFYAGSFSSSTSATAGPVAGHAFAGIAYDSDAIGAAPDYVPLNQNVIIEVRDQSDTVTPGRKYTREKKLGTWGSWYADGYVTVGDAVGVSNTVADMFVGIEGTAPNSAFVVNTESDNSGTDALVVSKTGITTFRTVSGTALVQLNKTASGQANDITGLNNGTVRWLLRMGDDAAESSTATGSNFAIHRYANDGSYLGNPFLIARDTGAATLTAVNVNSTLAVTGATTLDDATIVGGEITVGNAGTTGTIRFGNTGTKYLNYDGTNFNLVGGILNTSSAIMADSSIWSKETSTTGIYHFGSSGSKYLQYDSASFLLRGGGFAISNAAATQILALDTSGNFATLGKIQGASYQCRQGESGGFGGNRFNFHWTGAAMEGWVDNANVGNVSGLTSDYRTKKDVVNLTDMWDTVKALRPIRYTQAEFSPPSQQKNTVPVFTADDVERWGFIAHEVQATLTLTAASGEKDGPDTVQSLNWGPLVAALTKALQEAMARIETLEARVEELESVA